MLRKAEAPLGIWLRKGQATSQIQGGKRGNRLFPSFLKLYFRGLAPPHPYSPFLWLRRVEAFSSLVPHVLHSRSIKHLIQSPSSVKSPSIFLLHHRCFALVQRTEQREREEILKPVNQSRLLLPKIQHLRLEKR